METEKYKLSIEISFKSKPGQILHHNLSIFRKDLENRTPFIEGKISKYTCKGVTD